MRVHTLHLRDVSQISPPLPAAKRVMADVLAGNNMQVMTLVPCHGKIACTRIHEDVCVIQCAIATKYRK